ncbi:MAG: MBL fold metallo-hydrolase [Bacteroidota bacterium]
MPSKDGIFFFAPMHVFTFEVGPFLENTYLLYTEKACILIDPGFSSESEFQAFKHTLAEQKKPLSAVLLTHAHVDHVLGLSRVKAEFTEVPVYLDTRDLFLWEHFSQQSAMFGVQQPSFPFIPEPLPVNGVLTLEELSIRCLHTPGHAPDHTTFYLSDEEIAFCGDAIFRESVGRTDLYQGNFEVLANTIRTQLYTLPDTVKLYPGHGPATTVDHEKRFNPFVKEDG